MINDGLTVCLFVAQLFDWWFNCLTDRLFDWSLDWLNDWMIVWLFDSVIVYGWLIDRRIEKQIGIKLYDVRYCWSWFPYWHGNMEWKFPLKWQHPPPRAEDTFHSKIDSIAIISIKMTTPTAQGGSTFHSEIDSISVISIIRRIWHHRSKFRRMFQDIIPFD